MFDIIDGGSPESPEEKKRKADQEIEQLQVFVGHMRSVENSISAIKNIALKMKWYELDSRLNECHRQIVDTLSFVKRSSKAKKVLKGNLDKPIKPKFTILD